MTKNEELYDAAVAAVVALYGDTSVSHGTTLENLRGVRDEIDTMADAIKTDIRNAEMEAEEFMRWL